MEIDRRVEFSRVKWHQGQFISTRGFRPPTNIKELEFVESCCAYIDFSLVDMGRDRQLVYSFGSPAECEKAVEEHNKNLKLIRLLMPKEKPYYYEDKQPNIRVTPGVDGKPDQEWVKSPITSEWIAL